MWPPPVQEFLPVPATGHALASPCLECSPTSLSKDGFPRFSSVQCFSASAGILSTCRFWLDRSEVAHDSAFLTSSQVTTTMRFHHSPAAAPNSDEPVFRFLRLFDRNSAWTSSANERIQLGKLQKERCQCGRCQKWPQFSSPPESAQFSWLAF